MNVFLQLIKITGASVEPSLDEKKRSKVFGVVMGILVALLIFIPIIAIVGFMVYALTNGLATLGDKDSVSAGLALMLHIVALFSAVFGFSVVMSVFYFSSDLDYLLPLPISPMKIIGAKLASTMITENVMECFLVFGALLGFMVGCGFDPPCGGGLNPVSFIAAIVGLVTFPVVPICYCAIVCIIIMYFSKFLKNKDRVSRITAFTSIGVLLFLVLLLNISGGFDTNRFVDQLIRNDVGLVKVLDKVFINVPLLSRAMAGSFVSLLLYILVNAASVAVVLFLASKLYLKTVIAIGGSQGSTGAAETQNDYDRLFKESSQIMAYFKKEVKILVRTPAYATNCFGINLIWPVFIYLFIVLQKKNGFMSEYIEKLRYGDGEAVLYATLLVFGVSVLLTALNCLASSAITREGKHFEVMKYMPVPIMTQLNAKALVSIVISGAGLIVYIVTAFAILGIDFRFIIFSVLLSILSVIFTTYLGIYIDTMNPKLIWEDEVNALRGNYHVFYNMALEIILTAAVCAGSIGLYRLGFLHVVIIQTLILGLAAILSLQFYTLCKKRGVKNIKKIEM